MIRVFNHITIDGFFAGPGGEIDWFNRHKDDEYDAFARANAGSGSTLVFGRKTYELMAGFWMSQLANEVQPEMAANMNSSRKIVFSRSWRSLADGPRWENTTLMHDIKYNDIVGIEERSVKPLTILGSGSIVRQFIALGLIDELQLMVNPVILGKGQSLFPDVVPSTLKLAGTRTFTNGNVLLKYQIIK